MLFVPVKSDLRNVRGEVHDDAFRLAQTRSLSSINLSPVCKFTPSSFMYPLLRRSCNNVLRISPQILPWQVLADGRVQNSSTAKNRQANCH